MDLKPARIQQLPILLANQIAAGEVIERPASVVKELLENALDSGADTIHIEIGFGGLNQIKISDNGTGIMAEDLPLAIAAHATSKIRQLNDLYEISSMGFRGEALASIAAVSRMRLSSKPRNQAHAMCLQFDGVTPFCSPFARSEGTTVEVLDIFFNAPVRKKFLKSVRSEYQAIEMVVKRFALSAPHIALSLRHDDVPQLVLPAAQCDSTRLKRIKKLLGKEFVDHAISLEVEQAGMRLQGFVSDLSYERSQTDKQWVYINQRMVKDKLMNHAIKQAYEGLLYPGRHPACILYLSIPAAQVDVNVHPTKHEVRFQQPRLVHDFISSHLSAALATPVQDKVVGLKIEVPSSAMRETSLKQPLHSVVSMGGASVSDALILNPQFMVFFCCGKPYLVDVERLQQSRQLSILMQATLPLASRPLLVPVSDKMEKRLFLNIHDGLTQLGLQLDWQASRQVLVRTIPQLLPQLDIKKLMQHLALMQGPFTKAALLQLLVTCQSFDAYQLNQEEKALLLDYLQDQIQLFGKDVLGCMPLDAVSCRDLVYV